MSVSKAMRRIINLLEKAGLAPAGLQHKNGTSNYLAWGKSQMPRRPRTQLVVVWKLRHSINNISTTTCEFRKSWLEADTTRPSGGSLSHNLGSKQNAFFST